MKEFSKSLKNDELDIVQRAYKFFYCNRVCYNGFGGFSTTDVIRRNMAKSVSDYLSSIDGLYETHNRLSTVMIHNTNALDLIKKWDKPNTIMYLDPPYEKSTRSSGEYKHDMNDDDQDKFLDVCINVKKSNLIISGYKCERYEILEKNGFNRIDVEIKTQTTKREPKLKIESLWVNY